MSTVDVVVPCYNYGHYLKVCVDSVLSQRDIDVRVLVIDDASPDNTPAVAEQLAAAEQRVLYMRNEANLGLIRTANKGVMDWATADYVVLLSADDALTQGSLARATKLMDAIPDIALTYGMALMISDDRRLETLDPHDPPVAVIPGKDFLRRVCEHGNPVPTPCAVMRTSIQHRIGGYNPRFRHTSDVDMWLRAAAVGSVGVINAVQGFYRWHVSNMSAAYQRSPVGDRAEVLATCEEFFKAYGKEFPELGEWLEDMKRRLGNEAILIANKSFEVPGDKTWRDTLEFGKTCWPDYWKSPLWWKFLFKRLVGTQATALIQRIEDRMGLRSYSPPSEHIAWYDHGMQIGWWPENPRVIQ
jgi:glycosyltransferase involved in cell wall biosynthesis